MVQPCVEEDLVPILLELRVDGKLGRGKPKMGLGSRSGARDSILTEVLTGALSIE